VKWYIILILYPLLHVFVGARTVSAQQAGMERSMQSSLKNTFSYQITSTIGTQTSANVSGNILANTEAILNLQSGGKITNKIGDANGNASAVFDARPNGSSVNLQGITGENIYLIDDGTSFKSSLKSDESIKSSNSKGDASAMAVQSTTVRVESGTSSFISSFQKAF
jgi:hypothetical protein